MRSLILMSACSHHGCAANDSDTDHLCCAPLLCSARHHCIRCLQLPFCSVTVNDACPRVAQLSRSSTGSRHCDGSGYMAEQKRPFVEYYLVLW